jgi:hypothetical protein
MNSQTVGVILARETGGLSRTEPFGDRLRSIDADECLTVRSVFETRDQR